MTNPPLKRILDWPLPWGTVERWALPRDLARAGRRALELEIQMREAYFNYREDPSKENEGIFLEAAAQLCEEDYGD